jgi:hypothetical protein
LVRNAENERPPKKISKGTLSRKLRRDHSKKITAAKKLTEAAQNAPKVPKIKPSKILQSEEEQEA